MNDVADDTSESPNLIEIDIRLASIRAEYLQDYYEFSTEQMTSYGKWLNSSLLAVNGAGVVAILNSFERISSHVLVGSFFVAGLILALFSGWLLQFYYYKTSTYASRLALLLKDATANGVIDPQPAEMIEKQISMAGKFAWIPPTFGWVSAIAFLVGIALFIQNLKLPG